MGSDRDMPTGLAYDWDVVDEEELPYPHVQGYIPRANCLEQGRDRTATGQTMARTVIGTATGIEIVGQTGGAMILITAVSLAPATVEPLVGAVRTTPPRAAPYARTSVAALSSLTSSVPHANVRDMRLQVATCLLSRCSLNATRIRCPKLRNHPWRQSGLPTGGINLANPIRLPGR